MQFATGITSTQIQNNSNLQRSKLIGIQSFLLSQAFEEEQFTTI